MTDSSRYIVTTPLGTEHLLAGELLALDAAAIREGRGLVSCSGPRELGYRICLWSRIAGRVFLVLAEFPAESADELYHGIAAIPWEEHLAPEGTLAVDFSGGSGLITDTRFGAVKVKDAIVDRFREQCGVRPSVVRDRPDLRIAVRMHRGSTMASLDLSGDSLHRRGYREEHGEAPLKENLAAAILIRAGWPELARSSAPFLDPMCGSGTFPIEAALMAADIAPGSFREFFGFLGWKQHDAGVWEQLRNEAWQRRESGMSQMPLIVGYDQDPNMIRTARGNAARAGVPEGVRFASCEISDATNPSPTAAGGLLVVNPPYGERLGRDVDLPRLYGRLGAVLKARFRGWTAAVLTGGAERYPVGLKPRKVTMLYNGPLECSLSLFDLAAEGKAAHVALESHGDSRPKTLSPGAESFANRLRKNLRLLGKWARREQVTCWRLYDADLPEYNLAIDLYQGEELFVHVQEYEAPRTVDPTDADRRLREALGVIPDVLAIPRDRLFTKKRKRQKGSAQYNRLAATGRFYEVSEGPCRFLVNFTDYLDTGLFLDHRPLRRLIREQADGRRFLNLFGYTGAATVHAAVGGATATTTVDLSNTYLEWAERNLALNNCGGMGHELVRGDCREWLERTVRQGKQRWGLIFLDPPTFSNSAKMAGVLDIQRDHATLIGLAARLLEPDGILYFSTNLRGFRMDTATLPGLVLEDITPATIPEDFRRNPRIHACWRITLA